MPIAKFGAVIDALLTLAESTSVERVYDGPVVTSEAPATFMVIGGTEDPDDEASSFDQTWNGLGARGKNETGEVTGVVIATTGNDGVRAARDQALTLLAELEALIRSDPSLGGVLTGGWAQASGGRYVQRKNSQGLYARVTFTITYQTKS